MRSLFHPYKILMALTVLALLLAACGGDTPASLNRAGNDAFADAQYDTALASYQQVAQVDPALPQAQYNIGNTQFRMNQMDAAREALNQAAMQVSATQLAAGESRLSTAFTEQTSYNLGNVHFATEDFAAAIESYKAALRVNPDDLDVKVNLELALRKQKEQEEEQPEEPTPTPSPSPTPEAGEPTPTPTPEEPANEGTPTPTETMIPTETPTPTPNPGEGEGETPTPAESGTPEGTPTTEPSPSPASPTPQPAQPTPAPAQPTLMPGELSPEQAARILEAAADQTETLQEQLQKNQPVSKEDVDKDW